MAAPDVATRAVSNTLAHQAQINLVTFCGIHIS